MLPAAVPDMSITIYGDSILKGVLLENDKYVINRDLERKFAQDFDTVICNKSHFGSTLVKGFALLKKDLTNLYTSMANDNEISVDITKNVRQWDGSSQYAIIEFGGNDCDFCWEEIAADPTAQHVCRTPIEQFTTLCRTTVQLLRTAGYVPVLVNLLPIDSERYLRHICRKGLPRERILEWLGDVNAIYRWEERYSRVIEMIAVQEQTLLVDLRGAFLAHLHLGDLLCADGIHPNRLGQQLIYETFASFVQNMRKYERADVRQGTLA